MTRREVAASLLLTGILLVSLVAISSPAGAVDVQVSATDTSPTQGNETTIDVTVHIRDGEIIPIDGLELRLEGEETLEFDVDGTTDNDPDWVTSVAPLHASTDPGQGARNGTDETTGDSFDFGTGPGYGYAEGDSVLEYEIVVNTSALEPADYDAEVAVLSGNETHPEFANQTSFTVEASNGGGGGSGGGGGGGGGAAGGGGGGGGAPGGGGGAAGGGGGGGAAPPSTSSAADVTVETPSPDRVEVSVDGASADVPVDVELPTAAEGDSDGVDLRSMSVTPTTDGNFSFELTRLDSPPDDVPALDTGTPEGAIGYFEIEHGFDDSDVSDVEFTFSVGRSLLEGRNLSPDSVGLYRYEDGAWARYDGTRADESTDSFSYRSEVPGLSAFAVGADQVVTDGGDELTDGGLDAEDQSGEGGGGEGNDETTDAPSGAPVEEVGGFGVVDLVGLLAILLVLFGTGYYGFGKLERRYR